MADKIKHDLKQYARNQQTFGLFSPMFMGTGDPYRDNKTQGACPASQLSNVPPAAQPTRDLVVLTAGLGKCAQGKAASRERSSQPTGSPSLRS
jgi:hypothetical protein